ncbi:hypothetical protein [Eubacterium sp. MSJ-33]|uniref:hypothetical protein n=1 Tax=Eubacterium sp. MSJ-33 TaxID=2841528 RepID=UPI001C75E152|nr:hypothetical protein [Eubacterium sp. MSJ-33]QWT52095.1 hypothetical protein KP625_08285 [Eubacterium sp. MSJ-33]
MDEIETEIKKLKLEKLELLISNRNEDELASVDEQEYIRIIYCGRNKIEKWISQINSINGCVWNEILNTRLDYLKCMSNTIHSVRYINAPYNCKDYYVELFYNQLRQKYKDDFWEEIRIGISDIYPSNTLKIDQLDEADQKLAEIIDIYLNIKWLKDQMEYAVEIIDSILCSQDK